MVSMRIHSEYEGAWSRADQRLLCLDTGSWRTERPVAESEKCTGCGWCALYCPPQCMAASGDHFEPDLRYCKGCGICARECPQQAITMVSERGYRNDSEE